MSWRRSQLQQRFVIQSGAIALTRQICSKKSANKVQQKVEINHRSGAGKG
jgi:hypothetical protein